MTNRFSACTTGGRSATIDCGEFLESTIESIQCSDEVGVRTVVALDTSKGLSFPVFLGYPPTVRACPGGIARVVGDEENTVLLGQLVNPLDCLPVCPGGHGLPETFTSTFFLSFLHASKIFSSDHCKLIPRKSFDFGVDEVLSSSSGSKPPSAPWSAATDSLANSFKSLAVPSIVGIDEKLIVADIYSQYLSFEYFIRRNLVYGDSDPKGQQIVPKGTALKELCSRFIEPVAKSLMRLERNYDRSTPNEAGDLEDVIEGSFPGFDLSHEAREPHGFCYPWFSSPCPKGIGGLSGRDNSLDGDFQTVGSVPVRKTSARDLVQGLGVETSGIEPEVIDVSICTGSNFSEQSKDTAAFRCSCLFQRDFDRSLHLYRSMTRVVIAIKD